MLPVLHRCSFRSNATYGCIVKNLFFRSDKLQISKPCRNGKLRQMGEKTDQNGTSPCGGAFCCGMRCKKKPYAGNGKILLICACICLKNQV